MMSQSSSGTWPVPPAPLCPSPPQGTTSGQEEVIARQRDDISKLKCDLASALATTKSREAELSETKAAAELLRDQLSQQVRAHAGLEAFTCSYNTLRRKELEEDSAVLSVSILVHSSKPSYSPCLPPPALHPSFLYCTAYQRRDLDSDVAAAQAAILVSILFLPSCSPCLSPASPPSAKSCDACIRGRSWRRT